MTTLLLALAAQASDEFALESYKEILKEKKGNVFASPASIEMALAMAWNGANGSTREAMGKALRLQKDPNAKFQELRKALEGLDKNVKLEIANSLWIRAGFPVKGDYAQRLLDFFAAEVTTLDFGDPEALGTINGWVKKKTHDKIEKILDELKPDTRLILINAVYFKGDWAHPFDKDFTREAAFAGQDQKVMMMRQQEHFGYLEGDGFKAVRLPYGEKRRCAMYVFVPDDLEKFHSKLDAATFAKWMKSFKSEEVSVGLPRFKFDFEMELNDVLKRMGMTEAFDSNAADFSGMSKEPLFISRVKHKTYVDVNEAGTEAAAVTSIEMDAGSAMPRDPKSVVADRPFFVVMRDDTTGAILFLGSIRKP